MKLMHKSIFLSMCDNLNYFFFIRRKEKRVILAATDILSFIVGGGGRRDMRDRVALACIAL